MKSENNKIILDESLFIGEGRSRKCYIHPHEKNLCIKVPNKKASQRSVKREIGYFKRLKRRGKSFNMISKYFHKIQTNKGEGEIFELVRDYDGCISKDLRYYLNLKDENLNKQILKFVEDLRQYLINEYILFSDLDVENILLKKMSQTEYKLVVIDGIGDNNQIPFLEYVPILGIKRSIRKWEMFRSQLIKEFSYQESDIKKFDE